MLNLSPPQIPPVIASSYGHLDASAPIVPDQEIAGRPLMRVHELWLCRVLGQFPDQHPPVRNRPAHEMRDDLATLRRRGMGVQARMGRRRALEGGICML